MTRRIFDDTDPLAYHQRNLANNKERYQYDHWFPKIASYVASLSSGRMVCDLGCGTGLYTEIAARHARYVVGVDLSMTMLSFGARKQHLEVFVCGDATSLPFGAKLFDTVISIGLLEYVCFERHLEEARRVIRDNGFFLLQSPNRHGGEKWISLVIKHGLRNDPRVKSYLTRRECHRLLRKSGFGVERVIMTDGLIWLPGIFQRTVGYTVYSVVERLWSLIRYNPFAQNMLFVCRPI